MLDPMIGYLRTAVQIASRRCLIFRNGTGEFRNNRHAFMHLSREFAALKILGEQMGDRHGHNTSCEDQCIVLDQPARISDLAYILMNVQSAKDVPNDSGGGYGAPL